MSIMERRAARASGARSSSALAPVCEENVAQSLDTATTSAWAVTAQKPRPWRSGCQCTGSARRSASNHS